MQEEPIAYDLQQELEGEQSCYDGLDQVKPLIVHSQRISVAIIVHRQYYGVHENQYQYSVFKSPKKSFH